MARPRKYPLPEPVEAPEAEPVAVEVDEEQETHEAAPSPEMVEAVVIAPNVWTHEGKFFKRDRIRIPAADVDLYGERIVVL